MPRLALQPLPPVLLVLLYIMLQQHFTTEVFDETILFLSEFLLCHLISKECSFLLSSPNDFYIHPLRKLVQYLFSPFSFPPAWKSYLMPPYDPVGIPSKHFSHFIISLFIPYQMVSFLRRGPMFYSSLCPQPLIQDRASAH